MSKPEETPAKDPSSAGEESPRTPAQIFDASFEKYIEHVWKDRTVVCPVCGSNSWARSTHAADIPLRYESGRAFTVGNVWCRVCNYMLLFNASSAGLYEEGQPIDWNPPSESSTDSESSS